MKPLSNPQPVIALDLEGTLISNAVSQIPRPGLYAFLEGCKSITPRVAIYTTVREVRFREIANALVHEKAAPEWFAGIEYIAWSGATKDLNFIPESSLETTVLLDDYAGYVHPGQEALWIPVKQFDHPYSEEDTELEVSLKIIQDRLSK